MTEPTLFPTSKPKPLLAQQAENVYAAYPKKTKRADALRAIRSCLSRRVADYSTLLAAAKKLAELTAGIGRKHDEYRFIPGCGPFIRSEMWRPEDAIWDRYGGRPEVVGDSFTYRKINGCHPDNDQGGKERAEHFVGHTMTPAEWHECWKTHLVRD